MTAKNTPSPAWIVAAIVAILLAWAWSERAEADTSVGACPTAPPCLRWNVILPDRVAPNPVLVLARVWDADQPSEGTIWINDYSIPAFGTLGVPANDQREMRLSYEIPLQHWQVGANVIRVTWATNQSPSVHEIRELRVDYTLLPNVPPAGCYIATRQPDAAYWSTRVLWGCSNGTDTYDTRVLVLSPEQVRSVWEIVRTMMTNEALPRTPDPVFRFIPTTDSCDVRSLWGSGFGSC